MNVDNMEEAIELLMAHGFKRAPEFNDTVDTPTSRFNIMISPSGFIFNVFSKQSGDGKDPEEGYYGYGVWIV